MPGSDLRHIVLGQENRPRADCTHRETRQTRDDRVRPWHRVHLERRTRLGGGASGQLALHRAQQADAERLHRIVQRPDGDELRNESLFLDFGQARQAIEAWVTDYIRRGRTPRSATRRQPSMRSNSPQPALALRDLKAPHAGRLLTPHRKTYQLPRL